MSRILLPIWLALLAALDVLPTGLREHHMPIVSLTTLSSMLGLAAQPGATLGAGQTSDLEVDLEPDVATNSADQTDACLGENVLTGSEIEVCAAYETERVSAYFGSGITRDLVYDDGRQRWRARFPEFVRSRGQFGMVLIALHSRNGERSFRWLHFDPQQPRVPFYAIIDDDISAAGQKVSIHVDSIEPARQVFVDSATLGWHQLPLQWQSGTSTIDWSGEFVVADHCRTGLHDAVITVLQEDGSRLQRVVTLVLLAQELS